MSVLFDDLQKKLSQSWGDPELEQALKVCEAEEILGVGGKRIVIRADEDRVAKLAWKEAGVLDNEIEWRVWAGAEAALRELLCPTLEFRASGVSFQSLCLPLAFEALGERGRETMIELARYGISDVAVNLGVFGERIVCYDYCQIRGELFFELFGM